MNPADRRRWDRKYREKQDPAEVTPDPFLVHALEGIPPGRALELACGLGDNAMALAARGFSVTALDISPVALARAASRTRRSGLHVDFVAVDAADFAIGEERWDLIAGFYFLDRRLFDGVKRGLRPGGLVLYKTYTTGEKRYRPGLRREFLLEPGELKEIFTGFSILLYDEGDNGRECRAKILAQRPVDGGGRHGPARRYAAGAGLPG